MNGLEISTRKRLVLAAGRSHPELAKEIADELGSGLAETELEDFANEEIYFRFGDNVRGADVFILQTHASPGINTHLMEQLIMIDAAKRASAKRISAVIPFYGYARQDRKARGREPITARLVADLITAAGSDRVLSVDLHTDQIQGFFNSPFDHLTALPLLVEHIRERWGDDVTIVSPDPGRIKVAEKYANRLHAPLAILHKRRRTDRRNETETVPEVIGEEHVRGKRCVLVDDMIDTGSTITGGAEVLRQFGAEEIYACVTHGLLSGAGPDRVKNSSIRELVVTNTLPLAPEKQIDKLAVVSIAPLIARTIKAVFQDESVSEIFGGEN